MKKIIGNTNTFAIEIDILSFEPWIWGKSALVICNNTIGIYDEENILWPFIEGIERIAVKSEGLITDIFRGLSCVDIFFKIDPFSDEPDLVYELSDEEFSKYEHHDHMKLFFGENFDDWLIEAFIDEGMCTFIWYRFPVRDNENFQKTRREDIRCATVNFSDVIIAYTQLCELLPDKFRSSLAKVPEQ